MSKRKLFGGSRLLKKKQKESNVIGGSLLSPEEEQITDTLSAIRHIKSTIPLRQLGDRFPPIVFKHQIYSLIANRTDVDREVQSLAEKGKIKIYHLEHRHDEFMILLTDDFTTFVRNYHNIDPPELCKNETKPDSVAISQGKSVITRFLGEVVFNVSDISISKDVLINKYGFKDKDLTELVNGGLLTLRNAGSWWFSIPGAGQFVKIFHKGRQTALRMIQATRFKEILLNELKKRKAPSTMKLGILYHSYDLAGSDLVKCIKSTGGLLLRIMDD